MRILFLAPQPFFEVRGTPLAVRAMVQALAELGHEVDLLTFPQGADLELHGVLHRRSLRLPVGHVKAGPSLAKLLLDVPFTLEAILRLAFDRYDVVHAVEESAHLIAPFARLFGVPLVADVDSAIPDQLRYSGFARGGPILWLAEALDRHALRSAASVVTVCQSLTDGVRRTAPDAAVHQVEDPPLVTRAELAPAEEVAALRASLGLGPDPVVLYSGNFEPYQGVELLLDAAAGVSGAQFLFMGGEEAQIEALRARATASGARAFFSGKRAPSELRVFLALADVLASPRVQGENTPFKLYTYLASGRPIVATRIATHTQLVDDSLAFLAEPTPGAFAAALRAALDSPAEAAARAERGVALIEREYSARRYREKVRAAYAAIERKVHRIPKAATEKPPPR